MNISRVDLSTQFGANISKNLIPLFARAKGTCPLHKKPLMADAMRTVETIFPYNTIHRNNNEVHLLINGLYRNYIVISKVIGNAADDVRAIAAGLEYRGMRLPRYSPLTEKQKNLLETYKKKWDAFWKKRPDKPYDFYQKV